MLNDISFKKLTIPHLKNFLKNKIKGIFKLNKKELFNEYNRYLAIRIIQKRYRLHFYKNATDCITMDSVNYPCFIYRTKFGKLFFYNYDSIIKYIMKSGDTRDPMTRNQYTDDELQRLDTEAKLHFSEIKYRSTLKIKKNENYAKRIRNRENEILSFQMRLDELKQTLLYIIEVEMYYWELDTFDDIVDSFVIENVEYTSITSYINTILYEFKLNLLNLRNYDQHAESSFKQNILEQINETNFIHEYIKVI